LSTIFQSAVDWEVIRDNPVRKVKAPRILRKKPNKYDDDQLLLLLKAIDNLDLLHQTMLVLALATSVRQGELMGLEWRHVDFENNTIES
jgi:integrase